MAQDQADEGWDFDLDEHVRLLWSGGTGKVVGRTEYVHRDVQYLVEFVNLNGELTQRWVYSEAIDHITTTKH